MKREAGGAGRGLGVFGGTFNPVHLGHLRLAEDVREELGLERVLFVPVNVPPHKETRGLADPVHRLKMVELSLEGNPGFLFDDVEMRRGGVSYTIDTVEYLYGAYEFAGKPFLVIGSDLLEQIDTWKSFGSLLERVRFIVLQRDDGKGDVTVHGSREAALSRLFGRGGEDTAVRERFAFFEKRKIDITSTEIRSRVAAGRSIRYLVTDRVYSYIMDNGLYR